MTLRLRSALGRWGTTPIVWRTRTESSTTSAPATVAFPEVGRTRVVRIPIAVVLPAPLGPRSPKNSPARISRSSDSSATTSVGDGVVAPGGAQRELALEPTPLLFPVPL